MGALQGQRVVVVGASAGIGLAAAREAASEGADVVMVSRSPAKLAEAARTVTNSPLALAVNMLDRAEIEGALGSVGAIDHLVLSAVGDEYALFGPLVALTDEQVERSFDKLRGFVNVTRAAASSMRGRGSIVLVSGAGAARPPKETALAAAANASIVSFGKALAIDLAPVRVNVLMPGVVDTPRHGDRTERLKAWAESELPARRFGEPGDLAHAIIFLMTNPYVTAHTLVVDGGFLGQ